MSRLLAIFALLLIGTCVAKPLRNMQGADDYGNWCGGGHGGYQDCCNGGPCSACSTSDSIVTQACLKQCPPTDAVDLACAWHDLCCFQHDKPITCIPQGNWCACDCGLTEDVAVADQSCPNVYCSAYAASLQLSFHTVLSCWWDAGSKADCGANMSNICDHGRWP